MRPVGICLDGMTSIREMIDLARHAEGAGVDSLWVAEHVGYRDGLASSMALLTATTHLTVAPAATSIYSRHPMVTGMTTATLSEYAPGRVTLTLATGNPRAHSRCEWSRCCVSFSRTTGAAAHHFTCSTKSTGNNGTLH